MQRKICSSGESGLVPVKKSKNIPKINTMLCLPTCDGFPEMPDDVWFVILDSLDSVFMLALLSSASKGFCSLNQRYKDQRGIQTVQSSSNLFAEHFAENGWLNCLKYVHENGGKLGDSCSRAAYGGHYSCFMFAHEHGGVWDEYVLSNAAGSGCLEIIEYAEENGFELDWYSIGVYATRYERLNILKHIPVQELQFWSELTAASASQGNLEFLKYMHNIGCAWDNRVCELAASSGVLDCLAYAHEHGALWGDACTDAMAYGKLDCMIYAHEHGATLTKPTILFDPECLNYAVANKWITDSCAKEWQRLLTQKW